MPGGPENKSIVCGVITRTGQILGVGTSVADCQPPGTSRAALRAAMTIPERQFPLYESVILTEQMPAHRVPQFLEENPEFKAWYIDRLESSKKDNPLSNS